MVLNNKTENLVFIVLPLTPFLNPVYMLASLPVSLEILSKSGCKERVGSSARPGIFLLSSKPLPETPLHLGGTI